MLTSGFFNSLNGDRKYDARQMSEIFDGIIRDGIFASIGTNFAVKADTGLNLNIGIGRAWFNHVWIYNDAVYEINAEQSELLLNRIDVVVIEIDHSESVRNGTIKIIKGTPASEPKRPIMQHTHTLHQYPLAEIYRKANVDVITQADINSLIGTSETPFVTGILEVANIDSIVAQWQAQWSVWFDGIVADEKISSRKWETERRTEFAQWFAGVSSMLEGDVAANLARQIQELKDSFKFNGSELRNFSRIEDSSGDRITDSYNTNVDSTTIYRMV